MTHLHAVRLRQQYLHSVHFYQGESHPDNRDFVVRSCICDNLLMKMQLVCPLHHDLTRWCDYITQPTVSHWCLSRVT